MGQPAIYHCPLILILFAAPLAAADISVAPLPPLGFTNTPILVQATGGSDDLQYRVLTRLPSTDWNWDQPWSDSPQILITPDTSGWLAVDIQARDETTGEIVLNKDLGQVHIYDKNDAVQLIVRPFDRFRIKTIGSALSKTGSQKYWRQEAKSIEDFKAFIRKLAPQSNSHILSSSEQGQYAFAAVQIISGIWHYGNYRNTLASGCAAKNELLSSPKTDLTLEDYLSSDIGCCTDYATLLGAALSAENIENRIVQSPTHVFNEAKIDGQWWTLDANIGVAYQGAWDKVVDGVTSINVYRFSNASISIDSAIYSDAVADFQMQQLTLAAAGLLSDFQRVDVKLFLDRNMRTWSERRQPS